MDLNDELSWMNLVRRVRFYLPSGQFYDSDFDATMGLKEIKKIIGLIASIKKPFLLFHEEMELPDTNDETLNTIFKDKPFDEIIITQIHFQTKSRKKNIKIKYSKPSDQPIIKVPKKINKEPKKSKSKTKEAKNNSNSTSDKNDDSESIKSKEDNLLSLFKNYNKNNKNKKKKEEESKVDDIDEEEDDDDDNNKKKKKNKSKKSPKKNKKNDDYDKEELLKDLSRKVKKSGILNNKKSSKKK